MKIKTLESDGLLLTTAAIWGFAFVAQRVGMQYIGPFMFNAVRFALGSLVLLPLALRPSKQKTSPKITMRAGIAAGAAIFLGSSFQQIGMVYTTAGNGGFITGLYVVLVPFLGIFLHHKIGLNNWIGAVLAVMGLYFLTVTESFTVQKGDLFVLVSAFFWAIHVHVIGHFSPKIAAARLSLMQYAACSVLSFIVALFIEPVQMQHILDAGIPILYGGLMSVGIAYSLQVVAQKNAPPSHAAIILSLEAVFAVLGGILLLDETFSLRTALGCVLMLTGMLVSQLFQKH